MEGTLLYLILICIGVVQSKGCLSEDLPGEILGCFNESAVLDTDNFRSIPFPERSECSVASSDGHQVYTCVESAWKPNVVAASPTRTLLQRKKRGFFTRLSKEFVYIFTGRPKPRDSTAPVLKCPEIQPKIAIPFQTYAKVSWKEPLAHDNKDDRIRPTRYGRGPGRQFPEGTTIVTYEAKDKSGNFARCKVVVMVTVIRCPPPTLVKDGYFLCHPSTDFVRGGSCRYGCYDGFDLEGDSVLTCLDDGSWSSPRKPECKPWKCPALQPVVGADLPSCTNEFYFRSICSYNCKMPGFDMPPGVSKSVVCSMGKTWRTSGHPTCKDVEAPSFKTCPLSFVAGTNTGVNTSTVEWKFPTGMDNSNKTVNIFLKDGKTPRSKLTAGKYDMVYGIEDESGNKGRDCRFSVTVRDVKCAKLYPTPFLRIECPHGYRTGSFCNISCDPGKSLTGNDFVTCDRSAAGMFGEWNWKNGKQATCKNTNKCVPLTPPNNGALACDNWMAGEFCQAQCRNGTEMPGVNLGKLYVCSSGGDWMPNPGLKACQVSRRPVYQSVHLDGNFFFDGDCTSEETRRQIAENFVHVMETDLLYQREACPDNKTCNPDNVQVYCGTSSRKKRSETMSSGMILGISVRVYLSQQDDPLNMASTYTNRVDNIVRILSSNATNLYPEHTITMLEVVTGKLEFECPEGSVKSEEGWNCVECSEGTFFDKQANKEPAVCTFCPKGTYQDTSAQISCRPCPFSYTTHTIGSKNRSDCKEACVPGTYSHDGLKPCSPCEIGHFQTSFGQSSCRRCPESKSTATFGSSSVSDCDDFDLRFTDIAWTNITKTSPVEVQDFTISLWLKTDNTEPEMTIALLDENEDTVWWYENLQEVVLYNGSRVAINLQPPDDKWYHLLLYNFNCQTYGEISKLTMEGHPQDGLCHPFALSSVIITTGQDTKVTISQFHIWEGFQTIAARQTCSSNLKGNLIAWQQFDDATMDGAYIDIPSQCDDFDNCASLPCKNGLCSDALGSYTCSCDEGFTGRTCDANIDDCVANICMNNGTCVDGVATYTCLCPDNYTGEYCETEMVAGQWSSWGNWSECSTTCGSGVHERIRLCNNPTPDNGGADCLGADVDYTDCNNTDCPVCPEMSSIENGNVSCENNTDSINCAITCNEGFEFDIEPLDEYTCGPETFHVWNFETSANPLRRLPKCVERKMPETVSINYDATYAELYCGSEELNEVVSKEILTTVDSIVSSIACVRMSTCTASNVVVTNCKAISREGRSASQAGFKLSVEASSQNETDASAVVNTEAAFNAIRDAIVNGEFTLGIVHEEYEIDLNQTDVTGKVTCGQGQTRVHVYCVPCGPGSYLQEDSCKPCEVGFYQPAQAQNECLSCPEGLSTIGEGSDRDSDCSVGSPAVDEEEFKVTGIIVGCCSGVVALVLIFFVYRRYRANVKKIGKIDSIANAVSEENSALGPYKKTFDIGTISSTKT